MTKEIMVTIEGKEVSLTDLQNDVAGAIRKGYNHDFAFRWHTVQGLIDKVNELTQAPVDYEKLFKEAIFHLRCVSGSRNSFTPEVRDLLFPMNNSQPNLQLRSPVVEALHQDACAFLKIHDK